MMKHWKRLWAAFLAGALVVSAVQVPSMTARAEAWEWKSEESVSGYVKAKLKSVKADSHVDASSEDGTSGPEKCAIDGDTGTYWHSDYNGGSNPVYEEGTDSLTGNNTITVELENAQTVGGVTYLPRQDATANGVWVNFKVEVSTDGKTFNKAYETASDLEWAWHKDGNSAVWGTDAISAEEGKQEREFPFDASFPNVTHVKFTINKTTGAEDQHKHINAAEIGVLIADDEPKDAMKISVTAPSAGAKPGNVSVEGYSAGDGIKFVGKDGAEIETEVAEEGTTETDGDRLAFTGKYYLFQSEDGTTEKDLFNVGDHTPFVISFWMKADVNHGSDTYIVGKMDHQYGLQTKDNYLQAYSCTSDNKWPTFTSNEEATITEWTNVTWLFDGYKYWISATNDETLALESNDSRSTGDFAIAKQDKDFSHAGSGWTGGYQYFSIGYNYKLGTEDRPYTGLLSDMKMYRMDADAAESCANAEAAEALVEKIKTDGSQILDTVSVAGSPYTVKTEWTTEDGEAVTTFEAGKAYTMKVTLQALDSEGEEKPFLFTQDNIPTSITVDGKRVRLKDAAELSEDGKTLTVTYTFAEVEHRLPTAVTVSPETVTFDAEGQTKDITATVAPADITVPVTYEWKSSNDAVVTVSGTDASAKLTAVGEGSATVTVTVKNEKGDPVSATCSVVVDYPDPVVLEGIAVTTPPTTTEFIKGNDYDLSGMVVTATYSNESTKDVTESVTITGYDKDTVGEQELTISYTEGDVTKETTLKVTVKEEEQQGGKEPGGDDKPGDDKPKMEFVDVKDGDWYYKSVDYVNANKLMTGLSKTVFGPDQTLVRAQFATIIYRMEGKPKVEFSQKFLDVPDKQFYTEAVLWAAKDDVRVVTGYTNGNFGPNDTITREQMALMLYRYAKNYKGYDATEKEDLSKFEDAGSVSDYAKDAMEWAFATGIITGKDKGTRLDPLGNANRAECAAVIMRFVEYYK